MEFSNSERIIRGQRASTPLIDGLSSISISNELNETVLEFTNEAASCCRDSIDEMLNGFRAYITEQLDAYLTTLGVAIFDEELTEENKPIQSESLDAFLKEFERTSE